MFVVRTVRCLGCPAVPFTTLRCLAETGMEQACIPGGLDYGKATRVSTTRSSSAGSKGGSSSQRPIRAGPGTSSIGSTPPRAAPRAQVDALRLLAVLLAHWDNKAENQRLVCPPGGTGRTAAAHAPLAIIQDAGATFGPTKLDLQNWRVDASLAERPEPAASA